MTNVVKFPMSSEHVPEGARLAVRDALRASSVPHAELEIYDLFLSELWSRGFKVVPVDEMDGAQLSISGLEVIVDPSVPEGMILVKDARAKKLVAMMIFSSDPKEGKGQP